MIAPFACNEDDVLGFCAEASPPNDDTWFLVYDGSFVGDAQQECVTTQSLKWTPGDGAVPLPYLYIMVVDLENSSTASATHTAGVDIDGIGLTVSGLPYFADNVESVVFGVGDNAGAQDGTQVLSVPENSCDAGAPTFVSLGGDGGTLIVSFGEKTALNEGDVVTVYECGPQQTPGAIEEHYAIFVGVSPDPSADTWTTCTPDATGITSCTIPALPLVTTP